MNDTPITQVIETAIIEIQSLADNLDSTDTTKLTYDLRSLESKINALRSFILKGQGPPNRYRRP
jgi:hypothetical protein